VGRTAPPPVADAVLLGRVAELLADHGAYAVGEALELLVAETGLTSAVLRDADGRTPGRLRAVAGEPVHAVPVMRVVPAAGDPTAAVELPVQAAGHDLGILSLVGARPSQLPMLRSAAAVLALALAADAATSAGPAHELVAGADADADATADRLHDGAVQALVVAHYAAESATRGGDPVVAKDAVRTALVELRRELWHVRPRGHDGGGLAAALGLLSARLQEAGRPALGYVLDEPLADALPPAVASTAYRLVQAVVLAGPEVSLRVALRRDDAHAVLDLDGAAVPDPERWAARFRALGGSLSWTGLTARLVVPLSTPRPKAVP